MLYCQHCVTNIILPTLYRLKIQQSRHIGKNLVKSILAKAVLVCNDCLKDNLGIICVLYTHYNHNGTPSQSPIV